MRILPFAAASLPPIRLVRKVASTPNILLIDELDDPPDQRTSLSSKNERFNKTEPIPDPAMRQSSGQTVDCWRIDVIENKRRWFVPTRHLCATPIV
jgi:hypothetical protein